MAKSLVSVGPSKSTLRELFVRNEVKIKVPLYISEKSTLTEVMKKFKNGYSHLAIVCKDEAGAEFLKEKSEKIFKDFKGRRKSYRKSG